VRQNKEEKNAEKMVELVNDLTLDLNMMGVYLADMTSSVLYNRLWEVFESARKHKEHRYSLEYKKIQDKVHNQ
jgi:hypothetical protein